MRACAVAGFMLIAGSFVTSPAIAHQAAEIYIPIGSSPGLSGQSTIIGRISGLSEAADSMSVRGEDGLRSFLLGPHTKIYLDRSSLRARNTYGNYEDCEVGHTVEVKVEDGVAVWIKVRVTE